jgi:hypothetical protein
LGAPRAPFSGVPGGVEANIFARAPTFNIENWRPSKKYFVWPLMELLNMKLKSYRRGCDLDYRPQGMRGLKKLSYLVLNLIRD